LSSHVFSIRRAKLVRGFLGLVVLATAIALELGVRSSHAATSAVSPTMHATVSDNDTIVFTFVDGSPVGSEIAPGPTIPPGTYTIQVFDDSELDNFHLFGPGVEQSTGVLDNTSPIWTVTFLPGSSYRYQSDSHPAALFGVFQTSGTAGASGSTSSGSSSSSSSSGGSTTTSSSGGSSSLSSSSTIRKSSPASSQLAGTLAGTVTSAGNLKLVLHDKAVSKLKSGRYKVTVVDRSPARSFVVRENKHQAVTVSGVSFVGTHSVTVDFTVGKWTFYSSAGAKSTSFFIVVA
jgi:hypothetical protein